MFDNIYTRKDGYAFGLERSGFIVPTTVRGRRLLYRCNKTEHSMIIHRRLLDEKQNPLLKKKVRHG